MNKHLQICVFSLSYCINITLMPLIKVILTVCHAYLADIYYLLCFFVMFGILISACCEKRWIKLREVSKNFCKSTIQLEKWFLIATKAQIKSEYRFFNATKPQINLFYGDLLLQKRKSTWKMVFHCYESANQVEKWFFTATKVQTKLKSGFLLLRKYKPTWITVFDCYESANQVEKWFCSMKKPLFFLNGRSRAWRNHYSFQTEVL